MCQSEIISMSIGSSASLKIRPIIFISVANHYFSPISLDKMRKVMYDRAITFPLGELPTPRIQYPLADRAKRTKKCGGESHVNSI
jgi:hypothetical protein